MDNAKQLCLRCRKVISNHGPVCYSCRLAETNDIAEGEIMNHTDWTGITNERKYEVRLSRLQKLIALSAPAWLIADECLLVAGAVYDIAEPIKLAAQHAGTKCPRGLKALGTIDGASDNAEHVLDQLSDSEPS
jgi:hypothetical protein